MSLQEELNQLGSLDCAIIGGGVSGLYTGWRLIKAQDERYKNIAVFELSDRIGGRLLTWLPCGSEGGLRAELGGMRFFKQQQLVWTLIEHLGLEMTDFYVDGPHLLWYLRGLRMPSGDANMATQRYLLNQSERDKLPDDLIRHVIDTVMKTPENQQVIQRCLRGQPPQNREDWDKIKPSLMYKGKLLQDFGFWNILTDILSNEGYQYIGDAFGYYSLISNWNAAEAMQSIALDFTQKPEYKTLVEGYSQLPDQLGTRFQEAGGHMKLNCQLLCFENGGNGTFMLSFRRSDGDEGKIRTKRLVLALPRWSLEMLQPSPIFDLQRNQELKQLLDSVLGIPALKFFLLYQDRWWEKLPGGGIVHGRSVCDLPIRQTYYFRPDSCEQDQSSSKYGLLMVSYDDARAVDYWHGMEEPPLVKKQGREELGKLLREMALPTFFSGSSGIAEEEKYTPPPNLYLAPEAMCQHAKEQLALLHGVNIEDIPDPLVGAYVDWSHDPFGGGWNFWQPQVNVMDVMQRIKQPLGNQHNVYIVGEAYSGQQGWVEGTLTATELVLQQKLELQRPEWLPTDYYLGW